MRGADGIRERGGVVLCEGYQSWSHMDSIRKILLNKYDYQVTRGKAYEAHN